MKVNDPVEVVIYVGTGKLVGMVGKIENGEARIIRYKSQRDPDGYRHGLVTNIERASSSLQTLLEELFPEGGIEDLKCSVVLGNSKLNTYGFSSSQYYQGNDRTITAAEIRSVTSQTRSVATLPLSEIVLQSVPESFLVNDLSNIRNPLGLEAQRLGVNLKIFTMNFDVFQNIHKVFEAIDIDVQGYYPKTLTVSEAILTEQEKEEGVLVFDIAEDVTHFVLWKNGCLADSKVLEMGGSYLTDRIAARWEIDAHDARKAKEQYASFELEFGEELIPLVERNGQVNRPISKREFQEAFLQDAKAWLEKILTQGSEFSKKNQVHYPHYVFSGGGARIDGFFEFLQKEHSKSARIGLAQKIQAPHELLVDPSVTACLGLYRWLATQEQEHRRLIAPRGLVEKTLSSAKNWFAAYF